MALLRAKAQPRVVPLGLSVVTSPGGRVRNEPKAASFRGRLASQATVDALKAAPSANRKIKIRRRETL